MIGDTERSFITPTVFRSAASGITSYNFYKSLKDAYSKYLFLSKLGGSNVKPAGFVDLGATGKATTLCMNAEFYIRFDNKWKTVSYEYLRANFKDIQPVFFRFTNKKSSKHHYAYLDINHLGFTATVVKNLPPDKITNPDIKPDVKQDVKPDPVNDSAPKAEDAGRPDNTTTFILIGLAALVISKI